jgi:polar amino acid transport system substrate-binding protein
MREWLVLCAAALLAFATGPAGTAAAQEADVVLPRLRVPSVEVAPPEREQRRIIRFLTASDYPPFQFVGADGNPAGMNVDLARAICAELGFPCTIQALPWADLNAALDSGRADALIAGMRPTVDLRAKYELTRPYFRLPARFVTARDKPIPDVTPDTLAGKKVAVIGGTAHEAFLTTFFPAAQAVAFPNAEAARQALRQGAADLLFGDGAALSLWLGGTESDGCCTFAGGPYLESHFFGEGMSIVVRNNDVRLRQQLDRTLDDIEAKGTLSDLYLRWFPIGIF